MSLSMQDIASDRTDTVAGRRAVMALCADATFLELDGALMAVAHGEASRDLRAPETGLVMVRGRIGGDGGPFNLGEATVTRAAVTLDCGITGHAYQLGRDKRKARAAALLDALVQTDHADAVQHALEPVRARLAADRDREARRTAATRVNFFTLTRGED